MLAIRNSLAISIPLLIFVIGAKNNTIAALASEGVFFVAMVEPPGPHRGKVWPLLNCALLMTLFYIPG